VVAAVGNGHAGVAGASAGPDATPYPAAYPGVIGVGSIGPDGQRSATSPLGPFVDVAAPGSAVPALTRDGRLAGFDGSSFAAPFVSATAALIRGRRPDLRADQVAARILDTADPSPDGPRSPGYGVGVLDPYRAVTEEWPAAAAAGPAAPVRPAVRPAAAADGAASRAVELAGAGLGITVLLVVAALILPRGFRRGWRPGRSQSG
jgi:membrane-anchored mycosin MYCP